MLKSLNVKKAHLFVLYMAGGLFLWHRNDYLNDIASDCGGNKFNRILPSNITKMLSLSKVKNFSFFKSDYVNTIGEAIPPINAKKEEIFPSACFVPVWLKADFFLFDL